MMRGKKRLFAKTRDCYSCRLFLEEEIKCIKLHPHKHLPKLNCNDFMGYDKR